MPTSDGELYGFKYVNGHPKNMREGRQTVTAFGVLADVGNGYPMLLTEMTILTALRTAAMSAVAAKYLAPARADHHGDHRQRRAVRVPGAGLQGHARRAQAAALRHRSAAATENASGTSPASASISRSAQPRQEAVEGAQIITTVTADKQYATILTDNMVGSGVHINAVGGDCPGKTELHRDILLRSDIFVEYPPQTRIEGEIQQLPADHPVTELWQVIAGSDDGPGEPGQITLFDSVGFAIEDFSALRYVRDQLAATGLYEELDLLADPDEPRDLFGMLLRAAAPVKMA